MARARGDERGSSTIRRAIRNQSSTLRNVVVLGTLPALVVAITYLFRTALSLFVLTAVLTLVGGAALVITDMLVHRWTHHSGVDLQRADWNNLVSSSIARIGISEAALVNEVRLGRLKWFLWRRGWRDPDPRAQTLLAERLGIEGVELLSSVGYLEHGAALRLVRADRSEDKAGIAAMTAWKADTERAIQLDTVSGGGRLVGAIAASTGRESSTPVQAVAVPVTRGHAHREPMFQEYVAFVMTGANGVVTRGLRQEIERRVEPWWQHTAASWEDSTELINRSFAAFLTPEALEAAHVAIVPRLLATTVREHISAPGRPNQIAVIGDHHSGAPDVAALIADELGASFACLSNLAVERFGKVVARPGRADGISIRTRHEMTLASSLMGNAREGRRPASNFVWAYNDREAMQRQAIELADSEVDLIVCLLSSEQMMRYDAGRAYLAELRRLPGCPASRFEELLEERRPLQQAIQAIYDVREGRKVILRTVNPPPNVSIDLGVLHPSMSSEAYIDDVDAFFDEYARHATSVCESIERRMW